MVSLQNLDQYRKIQAIAKETKKYLTSVIVPGTTEKEIKYEAEKYMRAHGVETFWYYDIGAFVFAGKERTSLSISGKNYIPADCKIKENDIVTVDLSPCIGDIWGDYARTFILGNRNLMYGIEFQQFLHRHLFSIINADMTFDDLYREINIVIDGNGFKNADFNNNLGHTIEKSKDQRKYIEQGNFLKVKDAGLFTFEPHIIKKNEVFGFKMENIYYLDDLKLFEL